MPLIPPSDLKPFSTDDRRLQTLVEYYRLAPATVLTWAVQELHKRSPLSLSSERQVQLVKALLDKQRELDDIRQELENF